MLLSAGTKAGVSNSFATLGQIYNTNLYETFPQGGIVLESNKLRSEIFYKTAVTLKQRI